MALSDDDIATMLANAKQAAAAPPAPATTEFGPQPDITAQVLSQQQAQNLETMRRNAMLVGADTNNGAPVTVRTAVSAEDDPDSRLATLRGYYPDAAPLPGTQNFVYTDPASGSKRTYMPMGLHIPTAGDLVSLGPTVAEGVGAVGGGLLGSAVGTPGVGTAVGAGVGAAAGGEGYRQVVHSLLDTSDLRTPAEIVRDLAVTGGVNAVAPWVGENLVAPMVKGLVNAFRFGSTPVTTAARALDASGVAPGLPDVLQAGVATGSKAIQRGEAAVSQLPGGGAVASLDQATRAKIGDGISTVANNAIGDTGGVVPNPETFSTNINAIANDIAGDWETTRTGLDDKVKDLVGPNAPVSVAPLQDLHDNLTELRDRAPLTLGPRYNPAIDRLGGLVKDAGEDGTLPFDVLRNARTDVGKEISWAPRGTQAPTGQPQLQGVYDTLKDTLQGAAADAGPDAQAALAAHDAAVTSWNASGGGAETAKALSNPALGSDTLLNLAKSTAPQSQVQLSSLLNSVDPAQRATLVSGIVNRLGLDGQDNFNLAKFTKDWGGMTDVAKGMLFTGDHAPLQGDLNNLATVGRGVLDASGTRGFSNTAAVLGTLNAISGTAGYLLHGEPGAAVGVLAGNIGAPWATGKLLESRPFVNWLTSTMADPSAGAWGRSVAQLGAVGDADPRLRGLTTQLQKQMGSAPPP